MISRMIGEVFRVETGSATSVSQVYRRIGFGRESGSRVMTKPDATSLAINEASMIPD